MYHFYERKGFKDEDSLLLKVSQGNTPNRMSLFPKPDVGKGGAVLWSGSSYIWSNTAYEITNFVKLRLKSKQTGIYYSNTYV